MRSLIAIAALVACSGAWADEGLAFSDYWTDLGTCVYLHGDHWGYYEHFSWFGSEEEEWHVEADNEAREKLIAKMKEKFKTLEDVGGEHEIWMAPGKWLTLPPAFYAGRAYSLGFEHYKYFMSNGYSIEMPEAEFRKQRELDIYIYQCDTFFPDTQ